MPSMTSHAATTRAFFAVVDAKTKAAILANIAAHYGITPEQALAEVTDTEAESLLDYVTGPERAATSLTMKRHGFHYSGPGTPTLVGAEASRGWLAEMLA